jgi:regulatory protein
MRLEKIEALTEEKLVLHLEDGSSLRCGPQELLDFHLRSGMELEEETLDALREACAYWAVRRKAASLAAEKAMSAGELRRKLCQKGADPEHARRAADRLLDLGVLDERAYAAMVVRHYAAKGYGRKRVEAELHRRELPRELWEEALEELPDSRERLDELVRKRLGAGPVDRDGLNKLTGSLLRRGYSWEEVRAAIARNRIDAPED